MPTLAGSLVLKGIRDWLRTLNSWDADTTNWPVLCEVWLPDQQPPAHAGTMFVGISGVSTMGPPTDSYYLSQTWDITVSIWHRQQDGVADTWGDVERQPEPYTAASAVTFDTLHTAIIRGLHQRYDCMSYLSGLLDATEDGCRFQLPLTYSDADTTDTIEVGADDEGPGWMRRDITFSGLLRIEPIEQI